jgi:predicted acyl esterase
VQGDPAKQEDVWNDLRNLRQLFWEWPWHKGELALRHVAALDQTLEDYCTRGAYDEWWAKKENDFTRYWQDHGDIPATMTTGWYDGFPHADTEYFAAMRAENASAQRLIVGPWSHVGMRGDASWTLDVDFGPESVWGVQRYFDEQLRFFEAYLREEGEPLDDPPVRIFVMGGGSGRKTELGKLDHGGRWRDEREWPLARTRPETWHLGSDGSLSLEKPAEGAPRGFTYDPKHPVPTIGGNYCAVGELPADGPGIEPMWARLLNPTLRLRNVLTPGPADQKEAPEFFASTEPYPRLSERADILVYETPPLTEPLEVTGRAEVHLRISSSAPDTDFTAKLIDVYPPNDDYPDGYDLLLCDSIIRCRYREGFDREVFMAPGHQYDVFILLPPTSNLFAAGHRIRIDVSSSNFPRLDRNPNTGEPMGRHTHEAVAENAVHAGRVVLPVIPT